MTDEVAVTTTSNADEVIQACLSEQKPHSFFLYAGAGSGKTGSLISALKWAQAVRRERLWLAGRRIGVITYTNAATDEVKARLAYDPFIAVSTIHAFAWSLLEGFDQDIRSWLQESLTKDIADLVAAQAKGRPGTKAETIREKAIRSKTRRLANLSEVKRFVYSPIGETKGRGALNHSEVIAMTADLLRSKVILQQLLIGKHPILFVDESQDTNSELMDALLAVQAGHPNGFVLGLFGDTMQRIYLDGKVGLAGSIPTDWARPAKLVNHRCARRVLRLINLIRKDEDGQQQTAATNVIDGWAHMFVVQSEGADRSKIEALVSARMSKLTGKDDWGSTKKTLILEHHMAAARMGFSELFQPLYAVDAYKTGLIDGNLTHLTLLTDVVTPLLGAFAKEDKFAVARLVGKHSPLVRADVLRNSTEQFSHLRRADAAASALWKVCQAEGLTVGAVLAEIHRTGLFELPEILSDSLLIAATSGEKEESGEASQEEGEVNAWLTVLSVPFSQVARYAAYTKEDSPFGTHQGVKGLEFTNVLVVIDDYDARGFLFSYEKLFGLKAKTDADRRNESQGLDTTVNRTRRLFYVTCSRARESLAIVAYCSDPQRLRQYVLDQGWFEPEEVDELN